MMKQLELNLSKSELREEVVVRMNPRRGGWDRITLGVDASPQWVVQALDRAERGDMTDFVLLNRRMEERLPGYAGALGQLKFPLTQAEVRIKEVGSSGPEKKMADDLRRILDSDGFHLAKPDMLDALGVGYSVVEQRWGSVGSILAPVQWQPVRPDIIRWGPYGTPELEVGLGDRRPLKHGRWIVHVSKIRSGMTNNLGLGRGVAMFYLFYNRCMTSYMAMADIFGLPSRLGKYPAHASAEDIEVLREALHSLGSEAVALIKDGMQIELLRANASGNAGSDRFFYDYAMLIEDQVIKLVLGQSMTSSNGGGSLAKAEVAERGKDAQVRALAFQLSAAWRASVVRPFIDINYGTHIEAPHVWLDVEDGDDIKVLAEGLVKLVDRGLPVLAADILDRCGLPIPRDLPDGLLLHPLGGAETSQEVERTKAKAEQASRLLKMVCEAIDGETRLRDVIRTVGPELAAAGYELKAAA